MRMKSASEPALAGQIAVVTGAGRGIGAAIANTLASLGAHVVLCGRTRKTLEDTSQDIHSLGGQSKVLECDVADLRSVESAANQVKQDLKGINILVNNAGVGVLGTPLHELAPEDWDRVMN